MLSEAAGFYITFMFPTESTKLVTCTGEAALEVVKNALAAMERSNAQESNRAAADLAARALDDLTRHTEVSLLEIAISPEPIPSRMCQLGKP